MPKRLLAIMGAAALVASLVFPVLAAGPQPLNLAAAFGGYQSSAWIEQQDDWPMPVSDSIVNPTPTCIWSVNDHSDWAATGYLEGGASTSRSRCIVSDFSPVYATRYGTTAWWSNAVHGFAGLAVKSPSASLSVSVCYQPQGRCFPMGAVYDSADHAWWYKFCGHALYQPDDPALTDIAGSNGGRGVVTTVTMTVTNQTNKRVRDLYASGGFSSDQAWSYPSACTLANGVPVLPNGDYPFGWSAS